MLAGSCQGAPGYRLQLSVKAKGCSLDRWGPSTTPKSPSYWLQMHFVQGFSVPGCLMVHTYQSNLFVLQNESHLQT